METEKESQRERGRGKEKQTERTTEGEIQREGREREGTTKKNVKFRDAA